MMSKNIKVAVISFAFAVLSIIACIIYCLDAYDTVFKWFGISNKCSYNYVKFIDVGQGDCTLIHTDDRYILIDTGNNVDDGIALANKLKEYNVKKIECVIISHDGTDHAGGLYKILSDFEVGAIVCNQYAFADENAAIYRAVELAEEKGVKIVNAESGDKLYFGAAEFNFIWNDYKADSNNSTSLVTRLYLDGRIFLFCGDISQSVEKRMIDSGIDVKCDVLKAAHHGSAYSSSELFLDIAKPKYCVVSCSIDNNFGFPAEPFLSRISERDIKLYVTYRDGDITFNTSDSTVFTKK